jgi:hypothetical protein
MKYLRDVGYQQQTAYWPISSKGPKEKMADLIKIVRMLLFDLRYGEVNKILMFFRRR